ncbi:MAG: 2-oxoglutarate dehydrogenase, subunit, partial [Conexibacter sp.]|nr:2-oxoglutarate dehydrogenase, subunit [Conexibacter sp.]
MAVEAAAIQVTLPAMGESVTEGTILEWHKQVGDTIEADEIIVEVSTDKVDAEVPAPASGTIVAIHFAEGDTVSVGSVLAEIAVGAGDEGSPNGSGGNGSSASSAPPAAEAPADDAPGEIVDITTPAGGESVTEGTILEWSVEVGQQVGDGDTVVEISTDKVDMELPAPAAGTI